QNRHFSNRRPPDDPDDLGARNSLDMQPWRTMIALRCSGHPWRGESVDGLASHEPTEFRSTEQSGCLAPAALVVAAAVRRQRLFRVDLRNCLVPVTATGHRVLRGIPGGAAGHLHGRDVSGKSGPATPHFPPATPL